MAKRAGLMGARMDIRVTGKMLLKNEEGMSE